MTALAADKHAGPLASFFEVPQVTATTAEPARGGEELFEEAHELLANLAMILVTLHILGVALASVSYRENLVGATITAGSARVRPDA